MKEKQFVRNKIKKVQRAFCWLKNAFRKPNKCYVVLCFEGQKSNVNATFDDLAFIGF